MQQNLDIVTETDEAASVTPVQNHHFQRTIFSRVVLKQSVFELQKICFCPREISLFCDVWNRCYKVFETANVPGRWVLRSLGSTYFNVKFHKWHKLSLTASQVQNHHSSINGQARRSQRVMLIFYGNLRRDSLGIFRITFPKFVHYTNPIFPKQ